jgi:hypothetical protein
LGVLVGTAGLLWVYNLIEEKFPKFVLYFIVPFSVLVFFIVSFTHYVVLRFSVLGTFGFVGGQKGILFVEYSLYVGFLLLICLYNLAKKSLQEKDDLKRKRIRLIFIGCLIFGLTVVVVDFLMPIFFNSFEVIYLDNITFFLFLMFVIYSMVKHDLFGIKIMLAQFLVGIFLSLLFLNFLLSGTLTGYMWNGALLLVSMFLSYLIMKSIFREIKVHKALLETAQRNLDAEQKLRKDFVEISQKAIYKIEKEI